MSARVLIVDDNIDLAENVAELFEEVGAGVTICNTARQALERTKAAPFDLAVVDVRLPDMTSVELVPRLRALAPHGEVLLMTGNASLDTAIEAVRFDIIVVRPWRRPLHLRNAWTCRMDGTPDVGW